MSFRLMIDEWNESFKEMKKLSFSLKWTKKVTILKHSNKIEKTIVCYKTIEFSKRFGKNYKFLRNEQFVDSFLLN